MNKEREIVDAIISDLRNRSGLDNEWDGIDEDIQEEIKQAWEKIIRDKLASRK